MISLIKLGQQFFSDTRDSFFPEDIIPPIGNWHISTPKDSLAFDAVIYKCSNFVLSCKRGIDHYIRVIFKHIFLSIQVFQMCELYKTIRMCFDKTLEPFRRIIATGPCMNQNTQFLFFRIRKELFRKIYSYGIVKVPLLSARV